MDRWVVGWREGSSRGKERKVRKRIGSSEKRNGESSGKVKGDEKVFEGDNGADDRKAGGKRRRR